VAFTTNDSFNGVSFRTMARGLAVAAPVAHTVHHMPGGNVNYIDLAGQQPLTVSLKLGFNTYAAFQSLQGQRGSNGTLVYTVPGRSQQTVTASLISVTEDDGAPAGQVFASAEFLV
jgi:hypothetical protein